MNVQSLVGKVLRDMLKCELQLKWNLTNIRWKFNFHDFFSFQFLFVLMVVVLVCVNTFNIFQFLILSVFLQP